MIPTDFLSNNQMILLSITPNLEGLKKKAFDITRLFIKQPNDCSIYHPNLEGLKKGLWPLDSSSNNQMSVLLIIRDLGRLKKSGRNDQPKLAEKTKGRNNPGWNDPGRNNLGPKRLRAETTQHITKDGLSIILMSCSSSSQYTDPNGKL